MANEIVCRLPLPDATGGLATDPDIARRVCAAVSVALLTPESQPWPDRLTLELTKASPFVVEGRLTWQRPDGAPRQGLMLTAGSTDAPLNERMLKDFAETIATKTEFDD